MAGARAPFDEARFAERAKLLGTSLGAPLVHREETESTNDLALEAARIGAPHGALFVADHQTRGRGRRGHTWTSPPGENLTFSLLLRPSLPAERVSLVTLVVGLAVRGAASRRVEQALSVKWPNDVVFGRKKLAGILVETRLVGAAVEAVIVGVGVNVHMTALPPDIASIATSLALLSDPAPSREDVLAEVLAELEERLALFATHGLTPFLDELRAHDALFGERLTVGEVSGVGAGIDADGALLVDTGAGVVAVTSGTVERDAL